MPEVRCHIAGTSHDNDDGSSRQDLLNKACVGAGVWLVTEPDNPRDSLAVKVILPGQGQLGYLPKQIAWDMAQDFVSFPRPGIIVAITHGGRKRGFTRIMFHIEGP